VAYHSPAVCARCSPPFPPQHCCSPQALAAAVDPALSGPYQATRETVSIPGTANANLSTDVFYPRDTNGGVTGTPCPVIVLGHGFSQSKSQHTNHGLHLASRGYIVLEPELRGGSDHSRNADDLSKCVDWIIARNGDPASRYHQAVRVQRIGATGHSAGGLSALVAAARDRRIRAVAPMDPVDNNSLGVKALASVTIPVAITYSEPSSCNASGSAAVLYAAAPAGKRGIKIVGANHTDAQDPAGFLSVIACGAANATRQMLYRRYVTGWFEYYLKGDQSYAPFVFDLPAGQTADDIAAGRIAYARVPPKSALGEWRATNFGEQAANDEIAGPTADPDRDGILNLAEYALALDPTAASAQLVPFTSLVRIGSETYGAITFTRATMATDVV
jgi:dienelactone hydrolase